MRQNVDVRTASVPNGGCAQNTCAAGWCAAGVRHGARVPRVTGAGSRRSGVARRGTGDGCEEGERARGRGGENRGGSKHLGEYHVTNARNE